MGKSYKREMQKIRQKECSKAVMEEALKEVNSSYYRKEKLETAPKTWLEKGGVVRKPGKRRKRRKGRKGRPGPNVIVAIDSKNIGAEGYCIKCGLREYRDGYCWECFKEQRSQ